MAMGSDPNFVKCMEKFSDDDKVILQRIGEATSGMKCFLNMFHSSCNDFVKQQIMNVASGQTSG